MTFDELDAEAAAKLTKRPEITSERGEREWLWLRKRIALGALQAALDALPGARRAFPVNVAKQLGLQMPDQADLPPLPLPVSAADAEAKKATAAAGIARLHALRAELAAKKQAGS